MMNKFKKIGILIIGWLFIGLGILASSFLSFKGYSSS